MDEYLMRIGELAGFFGVSPKALRVYEKLGLLTPAKIDESSGYRYYSPDQVPQLDALLELRQLGFSLAEIQKLLQSGMSNDAFMESLTHKKLMWQNRISDAESRIDDIDEIIGKLAASKPPTKLHDLTEEERAKLLSRFVALKKLPVIPNELSEALWV